jgi:hypothetical protein
LEAEGFVFRDKLKLLQDLYKWASDVYRTGNNIPAEQKLSLTDLLNIYGFLRQYYLNNAVPILQRYTLTGATRSGVRKVGEPSGGVRILQPGTVPPPNELAFLEEDD